MKPGVLILGLAIAFCGCIALVVATRYARSDAAEGEEAGYETFINLTSEDISVVTASLKEIDRNWHPGSVTMLVEVARFANSKENFDGISKESFDGIMDLLHDRTGKKLGGESDRWYEWIWSKPYNPHPEYAQFKSALYSRIDDRFKEYFVDAESATVRLDEIRWGGVKRDEIPPLKDPEMISPGEASYLADTDVVFGVTLGGESRCYPKRILAWHEMYKDTIGGESVCGVY